MSSWPFALFDLVRQPQDGGGLYRRTDAYHTILPLVGNWGRRPSHKHVQVVAKASVVWSVALASDPLEALTNPSLSVAYTGLQDTKTYRNRTCRWRHLVHAN